MAPSTSLAVLRANQAAYRARKRAVGRCIAGGCWRQTDGRLRCPEHLEAAKVTSARYRERTKGA